MSPIVTPATTGGELRGWLRDLVQPSKGAPTLENLQQLSIDLEMHVEQNKAGRCVRRILDLRSSQFVALGRRRQWSKTCAKWRS